ncbi:MAG: FeoB-associated Cys-rich membrane protein [Phycisphaerae bacterium]
MWDYVIVIAIVAAAAAFAGVRLYRAIRGRSTCGSCGKRTNCPFTDGRNNGK